MSDTDPSGAGPAETGPQNVEPGAIDDYEVVERIGRGSYGVVYKGRDPHLKRDVAIKVCTADDEDLRRRFYQEAEIAGRLEHPRVARVHAFGHDEDGAPYLVQEFLPGEDLSHLLEERMAWSGRRKLEILAQVAEALAYAHRQGVYHRDVKPANVRVLSVEPEVEAKLMDFGIAKLAHEERQLTQQGVTMGTASYLPPEQVKGGEVDQRGDVFSFGVLAYELLTLERPFHGKTISALVYQIIYQAPEPLRQRWPGCPEELAALVERCLEKNPDDRYADFESLFADLEEIREAAAVGSWPALDEAWLPAEEEAGEEGEDRSLEDTADRIGGVTRIMPPGMDLDSTRPASRADGSEETDDDLDVTGSSRTRRVEMPPVPTEDEAESAEDAAADESEAEGESPEDESPEDELPEELRSSAHEISKLVQAGDFHGAMQQLEQTMDRRSEPPAGVDPERPTLEIDSSVLQKRAAAEPPPPPPPKPSPRRKKPPPETTPGKATPGKKTPRWLPRTVAAGGFRRPPRKVLVGIAFAVAALLAVLAGWWLGRGPDDPATDAASGTDAASADPAAPVAELDSGLVVQATPWARVVEVLDADGEPVPLPEDAATPLYLPLPEGRYTVVVNDPRTAEVQRCEGVPVAADLIGSCVASFLQPTSTDYFRDAGWWR